MKLHVIVGQSSEMLRWFSQHRLPAAITERCVLYSGHLICVNVILLPDVIVVDLLYIINSKQFMAFGCCVST